MLHVSSQPGGAMVARMIIMSSGRLNRLNVGKRKAPGFTLIELLVVVAIIALLISILLPSLNRARQAAKGVVCATRLHAFGQGSAMYESRFESLAPCDPWDLMPAGWSGNWRGRNTFQETRDPPHGWLALYALEIKPYISVGTNPKLKAWESVPHGFKKQCDVDMDYARHTLWEGFFCPAQNYRNTMSADSPEFDYATTGALGYYFKYSSGYMTNRLLRSATTTQHGKPNTRMPTKPSDTYMDNWKHWQDPATDANSYGSSVRVRLDLGGGQGIRSYYVQGISSDELVSPSDTAYMWDTLDYRTDRSQIAEFVINNGWDTVNHHAGQCEWPRGSEANISGAAILGARHDGKASVLYGDGSVNRDNQQWRNKRGDLTIASTWNDWTAIGNDPRQMGNQFHLMPCWRRFASKDNN